MKQRGARDDQYDSAGAQRGDVLPENRNTRKHGDRVGHGTQTFSIQYELLFF